jgi:hypothetical protein
VFERVSQGSRVGGDNGSHVLNRDGHLRSAG